ncbi:hypothetical protein [Streptomyces syringium]|uniref:hypothetical protein n=1 Tax=Streptomyces syringium TaxID=76729 RepID=UPI00343DDA1E
MDHAHEVTASSALRRHVHMALYQLALELGELVIEEAVRRLDMKPADVDRATVELVEEHLLVRRADGTLAPCSPETAEAHMVGHLQEEIQRRRARIAQINEDMSEFEAVYRAAVRRRKPTESVQVLTSVPAIRSELTKLSDLCETEFVAAHPVLPPQETLEEGFVRHREMLARGVDSRTLYPHAVLAHQYMQHHLSGMVGEGAQVRTTSHVPDRVLIYDRKCAVISRSATDEGGGGAMIVRDASLVGFLHRSWESVWITALPFAAAPDGMGYGEAKHEVRRAIVELLDTGAKDEVVARRLGMSVRACRRHIADIMAELGAESRFQAGSFARRAGWLNTG